ncbi:MAG: amidase related to nicotinamidase [Hyphomicrobiales bacterium]|nr:amidase related to nicotinamidase [Hyphomicrobiales bacterium]
MIHFRRVLQCIALAAIAGASIPVARADVLDDWRSVSLPAPPELKRAKIDPATTALLLMDFTTQTCTPERRPRCAAQVPGLAKLLGQARTHGMFVVYSVATAGSGAKDILAPLAAREGEPVLPPLGPDKFIGSDLEKTLKDKGIRSLIVTGTAAHTSVLHTGGEAALRGFKVIVPVDGLSSNDAFPELYTVWHLVNAARIMNEVTLTRVDMMDF